MDATPTDNIDFVSKINPETVANLSTLLSKLNISKAYYIDDYNKIDEFPVLSFILKKMFSESQQEALQQLLQGLEINYDVPDEDTFGDQIASIWEGLNHELKQSYLEKIHTHNGGDFNIKDYSRTKELKDRKSVV